MMGAKHFCHEGTTMKKKIIASSCILVAAVVVHVLMIFRDAGEFNHLVPHSAYRCSKVSGVMGPEDIAIDHSSATAFISSADYRAARKGVFRQGAIFAYKLEGKPVLTDLTADLKIRFAPHGISFFVGPDGRKYLFAVNHPLPKNCVEIFEFTNNALVHLQTVEGELIISPNDIAAVGPRQFYFTNDHGAGSAWGRTMEDYLRLPRSNIVYYDGTKMRVVAKNMSYANGIWATSDGKRVYATATAGRKFYVFERAADGNLKLLSQLDLRTGADNIDIDAQGRILIGAHPKLITFVKHAGKKKSVSPSQVLEVFVNDDNRYSFKELYLNPGDEISGCSVAAGYKDRLLLGAVFENHFLDCTRSGGL
jgi:arylesterase / paraoxonase